MPSTPPTNSTAAGTTGPSAATGSTKPKVSGNAAASPVPATSSSPTGSAKVAAPPKKKALAKPEATEGKLVNKSLQKTTRKAPATPKATSAFEKPAEADWHRLISEAAYYRAERRGFQPGYEQEDWAAAEEEVRKKLSP